MKESTRRVTKREKEPFKPKKPPSASAEHLDTSEEEQMTQEAFAESVASALYSSRDDRGMVGKRKGSNGLNSVSFTGRKGVAMYSLNSSFEIDMT